MLMISAAVAINRKILKVLSADKTMQHFQLLTLMGIIHWYFKPFSNDRRKEWVKKEKTASAQKYRWETLLSFVFVVWTEPQH